MSDEQDKHQDMVEALHALSSDEPIDESQDAPPEQEFDPMSVIGGAADPQDAALAASPVPEPSLSLRQRSAQLQARSRQAQSHQLKSIAIPLLLTVGVLLLICSLLAVYQVIAATGDEALTEDMNQSVLPLAYRKLFPVVGIPIGAFLLFGAHYFRKEMQQLRRSAGSRGGSEG